jgi:FkbM family methyltransferase
VRLNPKDFWTFTLLRDLWPHMGLRSILRFRDFSQREERGAQRRGELLALDMKRPARQTLYLREVGSDILTFNEVLMEEVYRPVVEHVRGCRTVIDLGANIGLATLYLSAHYPDCRFFAVEPNPDTFRVLDMNLRGLVRDGRAQILRGAVWGSEARLAADARRDPEHFSAFATVEAAGDDDGDDGAHGRIEGLPIQELIARAGFEQVDLVKADIEGAEVELFKGDLGWLRRVNALAVEFHGDSRAVTKFDDICREHGFRIIEDNAHTTLAVRQS